MSIKYVGQSDALICTAINQSIDFAFKEIFEAIHTQLGFIFVDAQVTEIQCLTWVFCKITMQKQIHP
jgi:hypothetical protein